MINDVDQLSDLCSPEVVLYSVEPHIFSVYPESRPVHHYDQNVPFYDRVIGNRFYNHLMWGYSISELLEFTRAALASRTSGWVLDAGCGSLVFNAGIYAGYNERPVLMLDESIQMLRAAKSRLLGLCGEVPSNVVFLQGDILQLPFRPRCFSTVISMSVLHVIEEMRLMIEELFSRLGEDGNLSLTSLVLGRSFGDRYLRYIYRSGGVASPRNPDQILRIFSQLGIPSDHYLRGNMLFIHSRRR